MEKIAIILCIFIVQEYVCWMTFKNWYDHNISSIKLQDTHTYHAMIALTPFGVIPLIPIIVICFAFGIKYLTLKCKF